jgi:hypothetical protein
VLKDTEEMNSLQEEKVDVEDVDASLINEEEDEENDHTNGSSTDGRPAQGILHQMSVKSWLSEDKLAKLTHQESQTNTKEKSKFRVRCSRCPLDLLCWKCCQNNDQDDDDNANDTNGDISESNSPVAASGRGGTTTTSAAGVTQNAILQHLSQCFQQPWLVKHKEPEIIPCLHCPDQNQSLITDDHIIKRRQCIQNFQESRKVVECRRIYLPNADEILDLHALEQEIYQGTYQHRAFTITNTTLFEEKELLLYIIESIAHNPDKSVIFTLSAGFYNLNKKQIKSFQKYYQMNLHVRMVHKMIPSEIINEGLRKCLFLQPYRNEVIIEVAVNHPHLFFSRMDGVYTQWESSAQGKFKS